jgi:hypothetical protein
MSLNNRLMNLVREIEVITITTRRSLENKGENPIGGENGCNYLPRIEEMLIHFATYIK